MAEVSAAELIFVVGLLLTVLGVLFAPGKRKKAIGAFIGGTIMFTGAAFGGLAFAGIPALINIPGVSPPVADSLFHVVILDTSDTDRTESGEQITSDGHTITYTLSDANMDGLGDVNLDLRVTNENIGDPDKAWSFVVELTFVSMIPVNSLQQSLLNLTDYNNRRAVDYSLTDTGSPTLSQTGESAQSNDWKTGMSDVLNIDMKVNPTAADDIATTMYVHVDFDVGGVSVVVILAEQT